MSDKLRPYSVTQGKPYFDWHAFLAQEKHTKEELAEALNLARDWVTCACGNQCSVIPRSGGMPDDLELQNLGGDFVAAICGMELRVKHNKTEAIRTLAKIEARSAELLAEMGSKL